MFTPVTQLLDGQRHEESHPMSFFLHNSRLQCLHASDKPASEALIVSEASSRIRNPQVSRAPTQTLFSVLTLP